MRIRFLVACLALCGMSRVEAQTACADDLLGLSDSLMVGERNVFVGTVRKTATPLPACALPTLPTFPAAATTQLVVAWGATSSLDTSFHGNVLVHSGSTLLVKPGAYRIGSLTQEWGSILRVDTSGLGKTGTRRGVQMVVMGAVQWMDGAMTTYPGLSDSLAGSKIAVYVPGGNSVVVDNGTSLHLQLTAPRSRISFGDRTRLWGRVLSRSVVWHNDATARYAAHGVPPTWTTTTTVSILGARRFWTKAASVPVNWTINGAVQTSQATETFATEGAHWIKRSSGTAADSVLAMVDWTAPVVKIVSPIANFTTNKTKVAVTYTVDGVSKTDTATLVEGTNTITRTATDSAGNVDTASVLVTLDTQAPVVTIVSPLNNSTTNKSRIAVTYTVDGVSKTDTATLVEGANTITRSATDAAGNVGSASIVVKLLTKAPVVNILSPLDNSWTNKTKVAVTYTVDGVSKIDTATLVEGANTITRSVTDAAGNVGSASITVKLDTKAPVVAIVSPVNNAWSKLSPVTLTYTVDGVQASELRNLTEGTNVLVVDVADSAGNRGSASVSVRLDTKAPVVVFTSPGEGDTVRTTSVALAWTVDGVAKTETITLPAGPNAITRTWEDSAGNVGSATLHFVVKLSSGGLVAVASAPTTGYAYSMVQIRADSSSVPVGVTPVFVLRQIAGTPVRVVNNGPFFGFLSRDPESMQFELSLSDSAGRLTVSMDTVSIQIREPATLWEQIQLMQSGRYLSEGTHTISITDPSSEWSYAVTADTSATYGLVGLDSVARQIAWNRSGLDNGSFLASTSNWVHPDLLLTRGDNLVRYVYADDSGRLAVDRALISLHDSLQVTGFDVNSERFYSGQTLTHEVRVRGNFEPSMLGLQLVQITAQGTQVLATLNDVAYGSDTVAGDGIWSGSFSYRADTAETIYLRVRGIFNSGIQESQIRSFYSQPEITVADVVRAKAINDSLNGVYSSLELALGPTAARDSAVAWMSKRVDVRAVGFAPGSYSIGWVHQSGVHAIVERAPEGTVGGISPIKIKIFGLDIGTAVPVPALWYDTVSSWKAQEPAIWDVDPLPVESDFELSLAHWNDWANKKAVFEVSHGELWAVSQQPQTGGYTFQTQTTNDIPSGTFIHSGYGDPLNLYGNPMFYTTNPRVIPEMILTLTDIGSLLSKTILAHAQFDGICHIDCA